MRCHGDLSIATGPCQLREVFRSVFRNRCGLQSGKIDGRCLTVREHVASRWQCHRAVSEILSSAANAMSHKVAGGVVHDVLRLVLLGSFCLAGVTSLYAADLPDWQTQRSALPQLPPPVAEDWLVDRVVRQAGVYQGANPAEIVLDNGLVRRTFRLSPNAATVALDGLTRKECVRAIRAARG